MKTMMTATAIVLFALASSALAADYKNCESGAVYSHGKQLNGQTCDDGVWRGTANNAGGSETFNTGFDANFEGKVRFSDQPSGGMGGLKHRDYAPDFSRNESQH